VQRFEALGEDQIARLTEIGIGRERIQLKRDPSPVEIGPRTMLLARPAGTETALLLLYSGNWGIAHDFCTFVDGYKRHHRQGRGRFVLWLNAVGASVEPIEAALKAEGLPYVKGRPVPIEQLASLLVTADAHLISLSEKFVGFVLPSKVYGCIASGRPILFIGSQRSDVHLLCRNAGQIYERVDVGNAVACAEALDRLAHQIEGAPKINPAGTSRAMG
jgi:hypothetical protein